jgi:hypothetical protein
VLGIGLSVNFPHSADDKYASVFKSSIAKAQEISGTSDGSEEKDTDGGFWSAIASFLKELIDILKKPLEALITFFEKFIDILKRPLEALITFFEKFINILKRPLALIASLLDKIIFGLDKIISMISYVVEMITDLFKQIHEGVEKSVESVKSIPMFGDVIAKILLMLVSILTIFFIIKIIDVLLP